MVLYGIVVYVVKWFCVAKSGEVAKSGKKSEKWLKTGKSGGKWLKVVKSS